MLFKENLIKISWIWSLSWLSNVHSVLYKFKTTVMINANNECKGKRSRKYKSIVKKVCEKKPLMFYSKSWYFTPNPAILLQTLVFTPKSGIFTPNPGILLQTLVFYSKPWYFTPNPGVFIQTLVVYSKSWYFTPNPGILI